MTPPTLRETALRLAIDSYPTRAMSYGALTIIYQAEQFREYLEGLVAPVLRTGSDFGPDYNTTESSAYPFSTYVPSAKT
jgi:hypothetical protein